MLVTHPEQYLYGAIFFPGLFTLLYNILWKKCLHKKVPISNKVINDADVWDMAAKLVTTTYAVISTISGFIVVQATKGNILSDTHWLCNSWARVGLPYYFYDMLVRVYGLARTQGSSSPKSTVGKWIAFIKHDPMVFFHHIIVPCVFYPVVIHYRNNTADFVVSCFYSIDFAVPFIQLRFILYRLELKHSVLYMVNGIFMTIAFAVCRVAVFPFLYYAYASQRGTKMWLVPYDIPRKCTISCIILMSMQLYWLGLMVRGVVAYFSNRRYDRKENDKAKVKKGE